MKASFSMPTSILAGENVVKNNAAYYASLGSRALIVSTEAARLCGALEDLDAVFKEKNIEYALFEDCIPNPTTKSTLELGAFARNFAPDFIVAVGGGSALDAGKAASVMVANPEYGIADLRAKTTWERAKALIDIAHPDFREELTQAAIKQRLWDTRGL